MVIHSINFTSGVCTNGFTISGPTTELARSDRCLLAGGGIELVVSNSLTPQLRFAAETVCYSLTLHTRLSP